MNAPEATVLTSPALARANSLMTVGMTDFPFDPIERVPRFHLTISLIQVSCLYLLAFLLWWFQLPRVWNLLSEF